MFVTATFMWATLCSLSAFKKLFQALLQILIGYLPGLAELLRWNVRVALLFALLLTAAWPTLPLMLLWHLLQQNFLILQNLSFQIAKRGLMWMTLSVDLFQIKIKLLILVCWSDHVKNSRLFFEFEFSVPTTFWVLSLLFRNIRLVTWVAATSGIAATQWRFLGFLPGTVTAGKAPARGRPRIWRTRYRPFSGGTTVTALA